MTRPAKRLGRPPSPDARTAEIKVRLSDEERATLETAASQAGQPLRTYVRDAALARARGGAPTVEDAIEALERLRERPVPHAAVTERVISTLREMTADEARETFVRSGILRPDGTLAPPYDGSER